MAQGQIIEQGRHEALIAINGVYANLWRVQSGERFKAATLRGGS